MADRLTEPSQPNVTKATRQAALREVLEAKRLAETANAKLRNVYKRFEKMGVTPLSIKAAIRARDIDPDALAAELRDQLKMFDAAKIEITQEDLFPDTAPERTKPKELSDHMRWEAHDAGFRAGLGGVPVDDNPFAPGNELQPKWVEGWHDGQEAAIHRSFSGAPKAKGGAVKVASTRRKKPGAEDVAPAAADAPVATAPEPATVDATEETFP